MSRTPRALGRAVILWCGLTVLLLAGCAGESEPRIVYITATPAVVVEPTPDVATPEPLPIEQPTASPAVQVELSPMADLPLGQPTPNPTRALTRVNLPDEHIVRPGDTLFGIAQAYGVSLNAVLANNELIDPNILSVGQVIRLPPPPTEETPDFKIIPDARLVRGPGSADFDVRAFVSQQPGFIRTALDTVTTAQSDGSRPEAVLTAGDVVERVSLEYSVDARLLLALLEYRAGWLSNPEPPEALQTHPLIAEGDSPGIDRSGLYRQLAWMANQLNFGYYGWKYRGWTTLEFSGTERFLYAPGLNAGTVALQYFLSLNTPYNVWRGQVTEAGLIRTYFAYFGDPFAGVVDPIVPSGLVQPVMTLPFNQGETWFFTGGAHGGWGSGSAWSALDFAPPDEPQQGVFCYVSDYWVTAVAPGVIARSGDGSVVLDLDGDGDESTGWTVLYLHIADQDRVAAGTTVQTGDRIGRASCAGGFSTATHLHIARRYNGEWLPSDCFVCPPDGPPRFDLGGWLVRGIRNQEYQGYLERGGEQRRATQGRFSPENRVAW